METCGRSELQMAIDAPVGKETPQLSVGDHMLYPGNHTGILTHTQTLWLGLKLGVDPGP